MRRIVMILIAFLGICAGRLYGQPGPYGVHDPVMIRQDSTYYVFCTGMGISCFSSVDKVHWKKEPPVFSTPPEWAVEAVPGYKGHTWAPDISYHNGKYWLLYSVSAFAKKYFLYRCRYQ